MGIPLPRESPHPRAKYVICLSILHLAAGEGKLRVASKLVELGADVHFTDRQGRNALDIARAAGYYDLEARLRLLAET